MIVAYSITELYSSHYTVAGYVCLLADKTEWYCYGIAAIPISFGAPMSRENQLLSYQSPHHLCQLYGQFYCCAISKQLLLSLRVVSKGKGVRVSVLFWAHFWNSLDGAFL